MTSEGRNDVSESGKDIVDNGWLGRDVVDCIETKECANKIHVNHLEVQAYRSYCAKL